MCPLEQYDPTTHTRFQQQRGYDLKNTIPTPLTSIPHFYNRFYVDKQSPATTEETSVNVEITLTRMVNCPKKVISLSQFITGLCCSSCWAAK